MEKLEQKFGYRENKNSRDSSQDLIKLANESIAVSISKELDKALNKKKTSVPTTTLSQKKHSRVKFEPKHLIQLIKYEAQFTTNANSAAAAAASNIEANQNGQKVVEENNDDQSRKDRKKKQIEIK